MTTSRRFLGRAFAKSGSSKGVVKRGELNARPFFLCARSIFRILPAMQSERYAEMPRARSPSFTRTNSTLAMPSTNASVARELAAIGRRFYARGWVQGTSGNFSAVMSREPLRLAITASSVHKGQLRDTHILEIDQGAEIVGARIRVPSAEAQLHVEIVRRRNAGGVLHTHSVWGTILSGAWPDRDVLSIDGFEMLKGLSGVRTHTHVERIPIIDNDQDMLRLASVVGETLDRNPEAHAFLLRRHGLYTWGATLAEAERHVEILEFLFEAIGRGATFRPTGAEREVDYGSIENS